MYYKNRLFRAIAMVIAIVFTLSLSGCGGKEGFTDDFKAFRGQSAAQIYQNGKAYLAKGKYKKASKQFEALDGIYPFGRYSRQGQLDLIYAYYMDRKMSEAAATAQGFISLYPQDSAAAYAYYIRGMSSLQQEGTWLSRWVGVSPAPRDTSYLKSAYTDFSTVETLYPSTPYAKAAEWYMAAIRNALAEHEMSVARYYYLRHAYLAAANRSGDVVQHYQGSYDTIPALVMMYLSYSKLGLTQQANDAWSVLQLNAPAVANRVKLRKRA